MSTSHTSYGTPGNLRFLLSVQRSNLLDVVALAAGFVGGGKAMEAASQEGICHLGGRRNGAAACRARMELATGHLPMTHFALSGVTMQVRSVQSWQTGCLSGQVPARLPLFRIALLGRWQSQSPAAAGPVLAIGRPADYWPSLFALSCWTPDARTMPEEREHVKAAFKLNHTIKLPLRTACAVQRSAPLAGSRKQPSLVSVPWK